MSIKTFTLPFSGDNLKKGALLGTIAHAIWVVSDPTLASEQYWDNNSYCVQDTQGAFGTITFEDNLIVGGFFDANSELNPLRSQEDYDINTIIAGIPTQLRELAMKETFQYMLQDFRGKEMPIITTVIWGNPHAMYSRFTWEYLLRNGLQLIQTQVQPEQDAIEIWSANYGLSSAQTRLLVELFQRRLQSTSLPILLNELEKKFFIERGKVGIAEAKEILSSIQIEWA